MDFEILVFRNNCELKAFVAVCDTAKAAGLSRRILSSKVLLLQKEQSVAPEAWGDYLLPGYRRVCGEWIPHWHETKRLHDDRLGNIKEQNIPFIEVFRGDHVSIIHSEENYLQEEL